ncbi:hypothetical protein CBR_g4255 [Chara braunii]|uniref:Uncharacterized protein n=1 Tax=Chara braunii TaxID=69332 RepID=A0A388JR93_CHABU|nr:hypothetical protein CBR_g4255 [Chara braunii]|eukprot:GBG60300.1 hypothetical protein CBR_g4255 [Chara braunii]
MPEGRPVHWFLVVDGEYAGPTSPPQPCVIPYVVKEDFRIARDSVQKFLDVLEQHRHMWQTYRKQEVDKWKDALSYWKAIFVEVDDMIQEQKKKETGEGEEEDVIGADEPEIYPNVFWPQSVRTVEDVQETDPPSPEVSLIYVGPRAGRPKVDFDPRRHINKDDFVIVRPPDEELSQGVPFWVGRAQSKVVDDRSSPHFGCLCIQWSNSNQTSALASASSSSHDGVSPDRIPNLGLFILDKNIWEYERVNCSRRYLNIESDVASDGQVPVISRMGATADDLVVDGDMGWNFWYLYSLEDEIDVEPLGEEGDPEPVTPEEMTDAWRVVCAKQSWSDADRRQVKLCAWFCLGQLVVPAPVIIDYYSRLRVFNRYTTVVTLFTAVKVDGRNIRALFIAREEFRGVTLNSVQAFRNPTVEGALRRFRDRLSYNAALRKEINFRVDCLVHSQLHYLFDNCDEISWKVEDRDRNLEAVFQEEEYRLSTTHDVYDCPYCRNGHPEYV